MGSCAWSNAAGGRLNCFLPHNNESGKETSENSYHQDQSSEQK